MYTHSKLARIIDNCEEAAIGERLLQRLAALAATLPEGKAVARFLELDGFQIDQKNLQVLGFGLDH